VAVHDRAWEDGFAMARRYAAEQGLGGHRQPARVITAASRQARVSPVEDAAKQRMFLFGHAEGRVTGSTRPCSWSR